MNRATSGQLVMIDAHAAELAALFGERVDLPGFSVVFPRDSEVPATAVPIATSDDAATLEAQIAGLVAAFAARGLPPRVELATLAWRSLPAALLASGFIPIEETPLLVCRPGRPAPRRPPAPSVDVRWVGPGDDLAFVASLMKQGFELRGGADNAEAAAALAAAIAGPLRVAIAQMGTIPAGSGCSTPLGEVTELSSVSTLPNLRQRGVASKLVGFLLDAHFAAGGTLAWACATDVRAAGLLFGVGFEDAGLRACFAKPVR